MRHPRAGTPYRDVREGVRKEHPFLCELIHRGRFALAGCLHTRHRIDGAGHRKQKLD